MLVITRQKDERIIVGDKDVIIKIVDIRGNKVRLGIHSAPDVPIHREEVYDAIKRKHGNLTPPRGKP